LQDLPNEHTRPVRHDLPSRSYPNRRRLLGLAGISAPGIVAIAIADGWTMRCLGIALVVVSLSLAVGFARSGVTLADSEVVVCTGVWTHRIPFRQITAVDLRQGRWPIIRSFAPRIRWRAADGSARTTTCMSLAVTEPYPERSEVFVACLRTAIRERTASASG
jgi:hypothetical protein